MHVTDSDTGLFYTFKRLPLIFSLVLFVFLLIFNMVLLSFFFCDLFSKSEFIELS